MAYKNPESYKLWKERNKEKIRQYQRQYQWKYTRLHPEIRQKANLKWRLHSPKYKEIYLRKAKNKIRFLGRQIDIGFRQQTGYCSLCANNVYDETCKRTAMHHLLYVPIMIWACRQEVCSSCHVKIRS